MHPRPPIEATCPARHCGEPFVADTHPEIVAQLHDHLREHHPKRWLRS